MQQSPNPSSVDDMDSQSTIAHTDMLSHLHKERKKPISDWRIKNLENPDPRKLSNQKLKG